MQGVRFRTTLKRKRRLRTDPLTCLATLVRVSATLPYRGRLAPTPTGLLHLGHVRTFAFAHSRARSAAGTVALRMDDLDPERSRPAYAEAAKKDLRWLGIGWDGEPWLQSRQTPAYRAAWQNLVAGGHVYPCRCSRRDLQEAAHAPHEYSSTLAALKPDAPPCTPPDESLYPGTCRPAWMENGTGLSSEGDAERAYWLTSGPGELNWRFHVDSSPSASPIAWHDGGLGPQQFLPGQHFSDFSIWRRDGVPAYQLASVVDDAALRITEVVRGADLLLSTARQLLLFAALGHPLPAFFHCPLVVDDAGHRLAKRTDALAIRTLREGGHSPAAVLALALAAPTA